MKIGFQVEVTLDHRVKYVEKNAKKGDTSIRRMSL